jgi:MurNAc alpha-1-phosphate uridylyltransferase
MAQIKRAMILAAGMGTRLGDITHRIPKPLVAVGDTCPLIRTLELLEQAGIEEVAINLYRFADVVRSAVDDIEISIKITYFHEEELLETGGAVKNASSFFNNEPFLLVNGDVMWMEEYYPLLQPLLNHFNPIECDSLLTLVPLYTTKLFRDPRGDFALDNNFITVPEDLTKAPYVYAGIQVMHPRLIQDVAEDKFSLYPCFLKAIEKGRLKGVVYNGPWVDIGTPNGLNVARSMMTESVKQAV